MNAILLVSDNIITAIITGAVAVVTTMITATVTYRLSVKKDRNEQVAAVKSELIKYHEKNCDEIKEIRENDLRKLGDSFTEMGANLQQKIAIIELSLEHTRQDITTLSNRVEKHNGVIERTYRLEDNDKLLDEKIKVANHRIEDLEKRYEKENRSNK